MSKDRNELKAGLFIVVTVVLIVVITVSIKGMARFTEPRQTRVVTFKLTDDLGGLRAGDDVRVGGFRVGTVHAIQPVDLDGVAGRPPRLSVTFSIPTRYKVHADARVGVQVTLTGAACMNIESLGSPDQPEGPLVGRPDPKTVALATLGDAAPEIAGLVRDVRGQTVPRVNAAVDTFRQTGEAGTQLVRHVDAKVDPVVGQYHAVTDKAGAALDSVHELIGPTTQDFHGTMANLHEITGDVKQRMPGLLRKVESSLDGARKAVEDIQKTVENTRDISHDVKTVIANNRGRLDGLIASVKTTGDNLKAASAEIRRSPWRLLYQPKSSELENLNLYDSARQFAEGANDLNDAAQALRDATANREADPQHVQKLVNKLETTFEHFHEVEQKLWTGVKE